MTNLGFGAQKSDSSRDLVAYRPKIIQKYALAATFFFGGGGKTDFFENHLQRPPLGTPLPTVRRSVWLEVDKVVYTLVCDPLDNPLLASNFL